MTLRLRSLIVSVGIVGIILILLIQLTCGGMEILVQVPLLILFGWIFYLLRVIPQIQPDPGEVVLAIGSLLVVVFGTHWFCCWIFGAMNPAGSWTWRRTSRVIGVVVLMFVCGTAAVGITHQLGWLASSPDPIVEISGGIRVAADRAVSANNLKQLSLATHNYDSAFNRMPSPSFTPDGRPLHSWHTSILPQVEEEDLYRKIHPDLPWDHPQNAQVMQIPVGVFLTPYKDGRRSSSYGLTGYGPNARLFDRPRTLLSKEDFPTGLSNTILVGETVQHPRPWGDPLNWRDPNLGLNLPGGFSGAPGQPVFVGMADGSVRTVTPEGWAGFLRGEVPID